MIQQRVPRWVLRHTAFLTSCLSERHHALLCLSLERRMMWLWVTIHMTAICLIWVQMLWVTIHMIVICLIWVQMLFLFVNEHVPLSHFEGFVPFSLFQLRIHLSLGPLLCFSVWGEHSVHSPGISREVYISDVVIGWNAQVIGSPEPPLLTPQWKATSVISKGWSQ